MGKKQQMLLAVLSACWVKGPVDRESHACSSTAPCSSCTTAAPRYAQILTEDSTWQGGRASGLSRYTLPVDLPDGSGGSPRRPVAAETMPDLQHLQRQAVRGASCVSQKGVWTGMCPLLSKPVEFGGFQTVLWPRAGTRSLKTVDGNRAEKWAIPLCFWGKWRCFPLSRLNRSCWFISCFQGTKRILNPARGQWSWYQTNYTPWSLAETVSVRYRHKRTCGMSEQRSAFFCHRWQRPVEDALRKKARSEKVMFWSVLSRVLPVPAAWLPPRGCAFQADIFKGRVRRTKIIRK